MPSLSASDQLIVSMTTKQSIIGILLTVCGKNVVLRGEDVRLEVWRVMHDK